MNLCLLSLKECDSSHPCLVHHVAYSEKQQIIEKLNNTTLNVLAEHIKSEKSVLPL